MYNYVFYLFIMFHKFNYIIIIVDITLTLLYVTTTNLFIF